MSKKILAFILAACMTLSMTACGGSDSSDAETQSSSFSETDSSENNSSETDSSKDESSETNSSETNSSKDESSEVEKVTTKTPKKDTSKDDSSVAETSKKVTETSKVIETSKPTKKVTEIPKTTQTPTTTHKVMQAPKTTTKVTQAPTVTPKVTETPKVTTPTHKPSHTHNWKPVYYTKYACYQATTDGGSFVSKTYYFCNENGDLASEQDRINYNKACEECEDYIGSPQNKTASTYAEISKPFGPSNRVAFYYCVNGSNIEATLNPNGGEIFNFYTSTLVNDVKSECMWVKGTIFENM